MSCEVGEIIVRVFTFEDPETTALRAAALATEAINAAASTAKEANDDDQADNEYEEKVNLNAKVDRLLAAGGVGNEEDGQEINQQASTKTSNSSSKRPSSLLVVTTTTTTVGQLRAKLNGMLQDKGGVTPGVERLLLMYCGAILKEDKQIIPKEV
jgi:hypothetical protein